MNDQQLSRRLEVVASYVPEAARLADIGTDHAYLPCNLAQKNKIEMAVAADVVIGPLTAAKKQIAVSGVSDKVEARLADGMEAVQPEDRINTVAICGMGGDLIARILDGGRETGRLTGVTRLILQPNNAEHKLRKWLQEYSFAVVAEEILEENDKIYEVLVAEPAKEVSDLSKEDITFGPFLRKQKSPIFLRKWQEEIEKEAYVLRKLENSTRDVSAKKAEVKAKMQMIKEALL